MKRALEDLRHEKEITDMKSGRVEDLEETVIELRQANRALEERMTRLCEAPFISDAFGQHEARVEFEKMLSQRQDDVAKIDHLQEAVRTQYSALVALKQSAGKLREEKEEAERQCDELRSKYSELEMGTNLLQDKLRLYSGEDGVNIEDLERALTVVKRRSEAVGKLDFLESVDGMHDITLPMLKKRAQEIQIVNLNLTKEVERLENMLKLQTGINRDLHKELEVLTHKKDKDKKEIEQKANDFEELAMKRLNKIHSLEAQLRELVYGLAKRKGKHHLGRMDPSAILDTVSEADTAMSENVLLADLLDEKNGDIDPDENMMEVWVKGASIRDGIVHPGCSSFVVVDFFDFESQTTALVTGSKPQWDFAATYKISVDDFFLRYLATDQIVFELNMASQGDFSLLARCTAPLSALLRAKPLLRLEKQPMISPRTGEIVAHLQVDIRMALPLTELYKLFLERHPQERKFIEEISTRNAIDSANKIEKAKLADVLAVGTLDDESRMYNELEITIFGAKGLPRSKPGVSPTPYVHFQLLGHPDKFTNPVMDTVDPIFNEKFEFPMITNEQQCRLLRRSQLVLTVIDMKGEESPEEDDGLLGEVNISLAALSEGTLINDSFTIKDSNGDRAGVIRVLVRWKHKFRPQRELGPLALTGIEVECLISSFSTGGEREGLVDYNHFVRFANPPKIVQRAMELVHAYTNRIVQKEGLTVRDIMTTVTEHAESISQEHFVSCFLRLQIDILPEELDQLFEYIDFEGNGTVTLDQILAILNLDEVVGVPPSLQEKLLLQSRNLVDRGVDVLKLFKKADVWGDKGVLTRLEFKSVLRKMGFTLVDEPDDDYDRTLPDSGRDRHHAVARSMEDDHDPLNDTAGSDDILLPSGMGGGGISEEIRVQKAIFEKKIAELQAKNKAEVKNKFSSRDSPRDNLGSERDATTPNVYVGKNLLDAATHGDRPQFGDNYSSTPRDVNPHPEAGHRTSLTRGRGGPMGYDKEVLEDSAIKLQSHYRGFSARKQHKEQLSQSKGFKMFSDAENRESHMPQPEENASSHDYLARGILRAEDVLRAALNKLHGVKPLPNILGVFMKLDSKQKGYVSRKQFAFAMNQFDSLQLPPEDLRVFMDYFDMSDDGTKIDYNAFVRFCNYRPLEVLPAVAHMKRMTFTPDTILAFRALDTAGTGFLSRQEMLKVMADIGFGYLNHKQALEILQLFETRVEGQVNYSNFVECVRNNDNSRAFDDLSNKIRDLIAEKGGLHDNNLRRWYKKMDREGVGAVTEESFAEFLAEFDLNEITSRLVISAVYNNMNASGGAVPYQDFCAWISTPPNEHHSLFSITTSAELQKKANYYLLSLALHKDSSLEELTQGYLLYDWRTPPKGTVSKSEFIRASVHVGFPFSHRELRTLSGDFASHSDTTQVSYKKFLAWCAPTSTLHSSTDATSTVRAITSASGIKRAGAMVKFLEQALERGLDLQSVFARYDQKDSGRITPGEFCSALSDLGLSSVSQKDAIELADRFKAIAGDFIRYRRIIAELLNQVDVNTGAADVDIIDAIKIAIERGPGRLDRLRDAFAYYDRKGMGRVKEDDIGTIFEESRIRLSRRELDAFSEKFSVGTSGWIQYAAFLTALEARMGAGPGTQLARSVAGVSDAVANNVSWLLENLILKGIDFRGEFDTFDDRFQGAILQADFRDVMQEKFRAGFTAHDLEVIEKAYRDASDPRKVNFIRMLQELHPRTLKSASPELLTLLQVAETLRAKIRKRCDYMTPGELKRVFKHFARRKVDTGFSVEELSVGMKDIGIKISGDQERDLFAMMNLDNGHFIKYNHFVIFVCDPHHEDVIWKLRRGISRARVSEQEVIESLEHYDTNGSGLITSKQCMKGLKACNIDMSEADLLRLMLRFDNEDAQRFDIDLFGKFLTGSIGDGEEVSTGRRKLKNSFDRDNDSNRRTSMEATETRVLSGIRGRVMDRIDTGFTHSEIFALFDEESKGSLDIVGLMKGARELGVLMSRAEARNVLRRLSLLSGGVVDKVSFFDALDIDYGGRKKGHRRRVADDDESDVDREMDDVWGARDGERERRGRRSSREAEERVPLVIEKIIKSITRKVS